SRAASEIDQNRSFAGGLFFWSAAMPFMHKLSRRMALLKDLAWVIPACALLSCEIPVQPSDHPLGPSRLVLSPQSRMIRVNQTTSVAAQAQTTTGSAVVIAVTFRVHG